MSPHRDTLEAMAKRIEALEAENARLRQAQSGAPAGDATSRAKLALDASLRPARRFSALEWVGVLALSAIAALGAVVVFGIRC